MTFELKTPPDHILLSSHMRHGRRLKKMEKDYVYARNNEHSLYWNRHDYRSQVGSGDDGHGLNSGLYCRSRNAQGTCDDRLPSHYRNQGSNRNSLDAAVKRLCSCGHAVFQHKEGIGSCRGTELISGNLCNCVHLTYPPVNRPMYEVGNTEAPVHEGNLHNCDYRYWIGCRDPLAIAAWCRWCGLRSYSDESRKEHSKLAGNCNTNLVRTYQLLLREDFCVYCEKKAGGRQKWGVPLCSPRCEDLWKFDNLWPYELLNAARGILELDGKLLPDYRDEKPKASQTAAKSTPEPVEVATEVVDALADTELGKTRRDGDRAFINGQHWIWSVTEERYKPDPLFQRHDVGSGSGVKYWDSAKQTFVTQSERSDLSARFIN